jgi:hypothetical protein
MSTGGTEGERKLNPPPTLEELEALAAEHVWSDRTPLTAEEKEELRARLNAPGGSKIKLTLREYEARSEMGLIRPREAIVAMYQQVRDEHGSRTTHSGRQFGRGILRAIEFATGAKPQAPITGEHADAFPPSVSQLSREELAAADVAHGQRRHPEGMAFAAGVEHTIMWLLARTDQRPWGKIYDS